MATSPKDKFDAAVKVIRGLPKNGSFQPSHELMLKFYSYFKQATEGPCRSPKPGFWDVVNRKKWDAWAKLGSMEAEEAMLLYVDELKNVSKHVRTTYYPPEIVETMPQTDDVSEFLQKLDNFYEMVEDSDNHNSLKVYNKQTSHGGMSDSGSLDQPFDQSLNGSADFESEFEHSRGITKLLQQDLRWWQDRTGVLKAHKANGDIRDVSHQPPNGDIDGEGSEDKNDDNGRDRPGLSSLPCDPDGEAHLPDTPGTPGTPATEEEWEEVEARASNSGSHSGHSGGSVSDSETENEEEFCDTSDEPAETIHPQEAPALPDQLAPGTATPIVSSNITASSASATLAAAAAGAKSVHFNEPDGGVIPEVLLQRSSCPPTRGELSDSMLVHPSPQTGNSQSFTPNSLAEVSMEVVSGGNQTMLWDSSYDPDVVSSGKMDISMCRGGEGEEVDRERQARTGGGGRGNRDGFPPTRGGAGHAGGAGGAGSRRGLFPGPGGGGGGGRGGPGVSSEDRGSADLNEQIVVTLLRLQHDMSGVLNRLNSLEALVKEGRAEKEKKSKASRGWWPLSEISFKSALIIFGWPLLIQVILFCISRRRRRLAR